MTRRCSIRSLLVTCPLSDAYAEVVRRKEEARAANPDAVEGGTEAVELSGVYDAIVINNTEGYWEEIGVTTAGPDGRRLPYLHLGHTGSVPATLAALDDFGFAYGFTMVSAQAVSRVLPRWLPRQQLRIRGVRHQG